MDLPVTPGFETDNERFDVAAKLGWIEGELRRANWVYHKELSQLTEILLQRIEDLESHITGEVIITAEPIPD